MKLHQAVKIYFYDFRNAEEKQHKQGKGFSCIFYNPIFNVHCHSCQVLLICREIQELFSCCFMDFFVNFIPGKSVSVNLENIFKIFWGSMPPDPPRIARKIFYVGMVDLILLVFKCLPYRTLSALSFSIGKQSCHE